MLSRKPGQPCRSPRTTVRHAWSVGQLPQRSLPVHPTQIYSSINAALLCLLTLAYYPFRRHDGEVIALLLTLYAITRFILEMIRTDEGNFYATGLTISQNVSLLLLPAVAALWIYILWKQPTRTVWSEHLDDTWRREPTAA